ncbi:MAG: ArsR/SmtB family transcription factor [Thermodesulfobacteriota bacterium]
MRDILSITKAISDESRLRILMALSGGELCVCQIIELLGLAPSTVSKHLHLLHGARLVDARKDGRWVYYKLAGRDGPKEVRQCLKWVRSSLEGSRRIADDARRLSKICAAGPAGSCR